MYFILLPSPVPMLDLCSFCEAGPMQQSGALCNGGAGRGFGMRELAPGGTARCPVPARQLPGNRWSLPRCSPPPPPASPAHHLPTFHIAHLHPSFLPSRSCSTSFSITCPLFHLRNVHLRKSLAALLCSPNFHLAPSAQTSEVLTLSERMN